MRIARKAQEEKMNIIDNTDYEDNAYIVQVYYVGATLVVVGDFCKRR